MSLLERKVIETDLFDEKDIAEVIDPGGSDASHAVPQPAERPARGETRSALLRRTREGNWIRWRKPNAQAMRKKSALGWGACWPRPGWASLWSGAWRADILSGASMRKKLPLKSVLMAVTSFVATCLQKYVQT
ncbi:MAG: hypothetical protein IPP85_08110 [Propionivibrio sp.]|nr:hypothetical protein [Propionivibrio sp.]